MKSIICKFLCSREDDYQGELGKDNLLFQFDWYMFTMCRAHELLSNVLADELLFSGAGLSRNQYHRCILEELEVMI
jgi:hypothetical protein